MHEDTRSASRHPRIGIVVHQYAPAIQIVRAAHLFILMAAPVGRDSSGIHKHVVELRLFVIHAFNGWREVDVWHLPSRLLLRRVSKCLAQTKDASRSFAVAFFLYRIVLFKIADL